MHKRWFQTQRLRISKRKSSNSVNKMLLTRWVQTPTGRKQEYAYKGRCPDGTIIQRTTLDGKTRASCDMNPQTALPEVHRASLKIFAEIEKTLKQETQRNFWVIAKFAMDGEAQLKFLTEFWGKILSINSNGPSPGERFLHANRSYRNVRLKNDHCERFSLCHASRRLVFLPLKILPWSEEYNLHLASPKACRWPAFRPFKRDSLCN